MHMNFKLTILNTSEYHEGQNKAHEMQGCRRCVRNFSGSSHSQSIVTITIMYVSLQETMIKLHKEVHACIQKEMMLQRTMDLQAKGLII